MSFYEVLIFVLMHKDLLLNFILYEWRYEEIGHDFCYRSKYCLNTSICVNFYWLNWSFWSYPLDHDELSCYESDWKSLMYSEGRLVVMLRNWVWQFLDKYSLAYWNLKIILKLSKLNIKNDIKMMERKVLKVFPILTLSVW